MSDLLEESEDYRLFCEERLAEPYPLFARLRDEDPAHWSPNMRLWLISRHGDVAALLRDKRLSASRQAMYEQALPEDMKERVRPLLDHLKNWLLLLDPPEHTRLRRLVNAAFTPRFLEGLRSRIQEISDSRLAALPATGPFDFVQEFSLPLSATVICEMLGLPEAGREAFKEANERLVKFSVRGGPKLAEHAEDANLALQELKSLFAPLIDARRAHPEQDLISLLVSAEVVGENLSDDMVLAFCVFLFLAGHEATTSSITSGLMLLIRHPEQFHQYRADPEGCLATLIEEILRYESAAFRAVRQVREDFELHGKTLRAGQPVILLLGAANRDQREFPDPDRFDVRRAANRHVAFGAGPHVCLGAPLARLEMEIAFRGIARHFPYPVLVDRELSWRPLMGVRSLSNLMVRSGTPPVAG